MTHNHTAQAQLRALRGQGPTLAQFLHFLGPGQEEVAPHVNIQEARDPETQRRVASRWLTGESHFTASEPGRDLESGQHAVFAAACLSLTLARAATEQTRAPAPGDSPDLSPLLDDLRSEHVPVLLEAAAGLGLNATTLRGLLSLTRLTHPGPCPPSGTVERGWWHLRLQTQVACTDLDGTDTLPTELAWLTSGEEDTDLNLMLCAWEAVAAEMGSPDYLSDVWMTHLEKFTALTGDQREMLITHARVILERLDELNPGPSGLFVTGTPGTTELLSPLRVPHRSRRDAASGALLNLWLMARLTQHWPLFLRGRTDRHPPPRQSELTLMELLCAERTPWNDAIWRMSQAKENA